MTQTCTVVSITLVTNVTYTHRGSSIFLAKSVWTTRWGTTKWNSWKRKLAKSLKNSRKKTKKTICGLNIYLYSFFHHPDSLLHSDRHKILQCWYIEHWGHIHLFQDLRTHQNLSRQSVNRYSSTLNTRKDDHKTEKTRTEITTYPRSFRHHQCNPFYSDKHTMLQHWYT